MWLLTNALTSLEPEFRAYAIICIKRKNEVEHVKLKNAKYILIKCHEYCDVTEIKSKWSIQ